MQSNTFVFNITIYDWYILTSDMFIYLVLLLLGGEGEWLPAYFLMPQFPLPNPSVTQLFIKLETLLCKRQMLKIPQTTPVFYKYTTALVLWQKRRSGWVAARGFECVMLFLKIQPFLKSSGMGYAFFFYLHFHPTFSWVRMQKTTVVCWPRLGETQFQILACEIHGVTLGWSFSISLTYLTGLLVRIKWKREEPYMPLWVPWRKAEKQMY